MRYLPHTEEEIQEMLKVIGVDSIDALFQEVPENARRDGEIPLEPPLDEVSLMRHLEFLANKNEGARFLSFLGGGCYHHHIPPVVDQLLLRNEFYTAYTPYQAEVSQGTLQAIFEFQTIVCELFGMDVANASMYDVASAAGEALLMARRVTGRPKAILSEALHPDLVETCRTYVASSGMAVETIGFAEDGCTDITALEGALDSNTACVVVGYPNFFGVVEKLDAVVRRAHAWGALVVSVTHEPYALGVLEPPGHVGVDIAVGEGQPLAVPPSYGGPGVGLLGIRGDKEMIQQLPGRLVGQTVDRQGQRAFVLTLSTREQHIRREKATSNICTNHNLIALAMAIRTALLGKRGFVEVSRLCLAKAEYLKKRLLESKRFILPFSAPTFNEVTLRFLDGSAEDLIKEMASHGVLVGPPLSRWKRFQQGGHDSDFLLAVTERHSRAEIDRLVELLTSVE